MKRICVFCGSSAGKDTNYVVSATLLGGRLAEKGITLVYGGAAIGIMGAVADAVLKKGGQVIGVIPKFLSRKEIRHQNLTELITVDSMHQRKQKMAELAEGFIALPGGFGTLEEVCEILTWTQLGLIQFPVGILNTKGYYDQLLQLFDHMVSEGFLKPENRNMILDSTDCHDLLDQMIDYQPIAVPKWLDIDKT